MTGFYDLKKSTNSQFYFILKAANGETILNSEMYTTKAAAEAGIASVRVNSPDDIRYDRKSSATGQPFFNLKAANHQVIGVSQMYTTVSGRDAGIESVKMNGPTAIIRDNT